MSLARTPGLGESVFNFSLGDVLSIEAPGLGENVSHITEIDFGAACEPYVLDTNPTGLITRFTDDFWTCDTPPPPASDYGIEYKKTSQIQSRWYTWGSRSPTVVDACTPRCSIGKSSIPYIPCVITLGYRSLRPPENNLAGF